MGFVLLSICESVIMERLHSSAKKESLTLDEVRTHPGGENPNRVAKA